jgi:hypothetical protein
MALPSREEMEQLLYRRQFVLGPRFLEGFPEWKRLRLGEDLLLTAHPDLPVTQAVGGGRGITLLGYMLDPGHPEATDSDILAELLEHLRASPSIEEFLSCTGRLGGRWILVVDDGRQVCLFNDATGLRQVFYTSPEVGLGLWCASQPGALAELLHLSVDADAQSFINSPEYQQDLEPWWPGTTSPYRGVRHLLPNHLLDLRQGRVKRFWPAGRLPSLSLEECVGLIVPLLRGLVVSAQHRGRLAVSLTAGWDSRIVLAATREIKDRTLYFTARYWKISEQSPDIVIPRRLSAKLGFEHKVWACPEVMDEDFARLYCRNVVGAHDAWGVIAQGLLKHYPSDHLCVKGNGGEIGKCFYQVKRKSSKAELTAGELAELTHMPASAFVLGAFQAWLAQARGPAQAAGTDLLDLFYWEQRMGSWQAMSQLEWDLVQEVFTPFNCRDLLATMLGVEVKYRMAPRFLLHRELVGRLWPEALCEPINPVGLRRTVKTFLIWAYMRSRLHLLLPQRLKTVIGQLLERYRDRRKLPEHAPQRFSPPHK